MIRCTTTIGKNERDIFAEISLSLRKNRTERIIARVILFCAAAAALCAGLCSFLRDGLASGVAAWCVAGILFLALGIWGKRYQRARMKCRMGQAEEALLQRMPEELVYDGERNYIFSDEGVVITNYSGEFPYNGGSFISYANIDHYRYLRTFNDGFVLVDKSTMTGGEIEGLYDLLQQNIRRNKGR